MAAMNGAAGLMEAISARLRRGDVTLERADSSGDLSAGPAELRWHDAPIATYSGEQRLFRCGQCPVTAFVARPMAEHWLGTHADFKAFQCPHCPYMSSWQRCVRMHLVRHHGDRVSEVSEFNNSNVMTEILDRLAVLKRQGEQQAPTSPSEEEAADGAEEASGKRHHCPYCPYSTHRRDLYNRHENIHKSDKPFQCYICQRMFNRADHVKKHFLRIHRDDPYDVTRIRRIPPKTLTAQVYYTRAPAIAAERHIKPRAKATPPPPSPPLAREETKPLVLSPNARKENRQQPLGGSVPVSDAADDGAGGDAAEPAERAGRQGSFACAECPWRGFDSWCLKRHMNTHTKPYTCPLCPYKAARSERLTWHASKVHAKKICIKCFFVCDDPVALSMHQLNTHQNGQSRQGFTCVMCASSFQLHAELEAHMVTDHGRQMLDCAVCLFRTTDPAVLTDHVRYSHQRGRGSPPPRSRPRRSPAGDGVLLAGPAGCGAASG
ncbi:zinc finger protein 425-like [Pollicipes pollicipes]|uniref:zinc finger protein 425-like n=1 Tax=Pollicipes pollicipes TaxID=41117 RepID=UPI001885053D|nr:zinc finger protein 425-like [Pollicipes pollicipes]